MLGATCVLASLLAACQTATPENIAEMPHAVPVSPTVAAQPGALLLSAPASIGTEAPRFETFSGTGEFTAATSRSQAELRSDGDVTLDFVDAELRDVVQAVLGEILAVPYSIGPGIAGRITLRTSEPVRKEDVLPALEASLRIAGAALAEADGVYSVLPVDEARRRVGAPSIASAGAKPGYALEIVPLRFIAAAEMAEILEPLASPDAITRVDANRNLLIVAGSSEERRSLLETIALFDVDWLKAMSFALVRPRHSTAAALAAELKSVFEGSGNPIAGTVRFVNLPRTNALLVVTPRKEQLREVALWVDRLDVPAAPSSTRIYYLRLQNAKAADIAKALQAVFQPAGAAPRPASEGTPVDRVEPETGSNADEGSPSGEPLAFQAGTAAIVTDEAKNALIIRASEAEYRSIESVVRQMDVPINQVLIEAMIAEVSLNDSLKYGVEWFFENYEQTYGFGPSGTPSARFPGFAFTYSVPDVKIAINALAALTSVNVISSPKVMTLDNEPATLQVGDQVPIITQTARSIDDAGAPIVNTVQLRDTGIILSVTPRVSNAGDVVLEVSQEVSDVVPTTTSGIDSPTIRQRKISTAVAVRNGETVALGGLMRETSTTSRDGVPVLKDVPLIGEVFSSNSRATEKTELLIFITPRVVPGAGSAGAMTRDLQDEMQSLKQFLSATRGGG